MSSGHSKGHREWLMERLSALALLGLVPWILLDGPSLETLSHEGLIAWLRLPFRLFGLVLLLAVAVWHSGLGVRSILTDYVAQGRARSLIQLIVRLVLMLSGAVGLASSLRLYFEGTP